MDKINLVIAEPDSAYLNGLVNYISNKYENEFRITCFTELKYLEKYIDENRIIDILLVNSSMYIQEIKSITASSIIILSEGNISNDFNDYPVIKKYQNGERICKEMMDIYYNIKPKIKDDEDLKSANTNIITIYSPIGGIGKSSLAVMLASKFNELNKDVLYLNLEDLETTSVFFKCYSEKNMSDLLYRVKEKSSKFSDVLNDTVIKDVETGINYFSPVDSVLDIEELSIEDIKFMLNNLLDLNIYDYIVIDLSSRFNSNYKAIFKLSSKVIVPIGQDKISSVKIESFLKQIDDTNNLIFIQNKFRQKFEATIPEALKREKKAIIQKIYYDENMENVINLQFVKNNADIFSRGINELAMKLI